MASSLQDHFSGEHSGDIVALHVSLLQHVTQMKDKDYNIFLPANIARFYHMGGTFQRNAVSRRWRPEPVFGVWKHCQFAYLSSVFSVVSHWISNH